MASPISDDSETWAWKLVMEDGGPIKAPVTVKYTKLFINGEFVDSVSGKTFETFDPRTEETITSVSEATSEDVDLAVKAARAAFDHGPWPRMSGQERGRILHKYADLLLQHLDEIAALETWDSGKPLDMVKMGDVPTSANIMRYYAGYADKIHGLTLKMSGQYQGYTLHEPIGVCGQIIPWNYPLLMFFSKISPALACGCTVVIKSAEQTPLTALYCAHLSREVGIPPGVLNVLSGFGETTGATISKHMDIDKIAFTGSTEVGRLVMEAAGRSNLKDVTLELGGKSPLIIMDDFDIDEAINIAHRAAYVNMGQICMAGSRVFVQETVYDEFVKKIIKRVQKQVVGDPFKEGVQHGPQDNMRIAQEEIFGPIMSILKFKTIEEVIERGNKTIYGLVAGVLTNNINTANRIARSLRAGRVWINSFYASSPDCPLGGYKMSGIGRELGLKGLESYLQVKCVITPLQESPWL
ncbi:aldehyde dehydrogenase family 2 member B4, mitochondrial isoform X2 [Cryptomeria japonica]|uniref:aldehyde dehydrogenase family 2 member B4, mitochondrial isoform X2 n=1 Tax=Cryptomeria japonica TaxID=3369 RepID=UPI0027D9F5CC|nr:aldehyde dehydrogenase family 2 member B4, mitochondrial isoform X2 [Cryptomeria japonica]